MLVTLKLIASKHRSNDKCEAGARLTRARRGQRQWQGEDHSELACGMQPTAPRTNQIGKSNRRCFSSRFRVVALSMALFMRYFLESKFMNAGLDNAADMTRNSVGRTGWSQMLL